MPAAPDWQNPPESAPGFGDVGGGGYSGLDVYGPSMEMPAPLQATQELQDLLARSSSGYKGFEAEQAAQDFAALLEQNTSELQQLFRRLPDFVTQGGDVLAEEALSQGVPLLGLIAAGAAGILTPSSIAPSDVNALEQNNPELITQAGGIPTSLLNETMDVTVSPPADQSWVGPSADNPNPWGDAKPETAHPPAPAPQFEPEFNPQLTQWSLPQNVPDALTRFGTAMAPFNHLNPPKQTGKAPRPSSSPLKGSRTSSQSVSRDCNKGKKPGQCRQGYFREKTSGDLELITWSTRRCP